MTQTEMRRADIEFRIKIERDGLQLNVEESIHGRGVKALFGPSGCGKSTLLRAIAGLDYYASGLLRVGDAVWQDAQRFLPTHQRPLGVVFQQPGLFSHLTVEENLQYGLKRLAPALRKVSLQQAVELLGIGHLLRRRPDQLSGGEQQRVAIARASAVSPQRLLPDEPLAALDQRRKQEILPYLESLHRELEIPVLYVSHSRDEVARLADHLLLLEAGQVVAAGPMEELFSRLDLSIAHEADTATVIEATVAERDEAFGLTLLDFPGGRFTVTCIQCEIGQPMRLQILARDVSLTLERQQGTSILNIFPVTVEEMVEDGAAQMVVRVRLGEVPLLVKITRKSATELALRPGMTLFAQVKSVALLS